MQRLPEPTLSGSVRQTGGGNNAFHNFANDYSHIANPNLRRRLALSDIDKVPFGLQHVRAVAVAGVGFFLDSYDIFAINLIIPFLGLVYWDGTPDQAANGFGGNNGRLPTPVNQALKASTSAGIIVGQVLFGWLADRHGRRRMYGIELGVILLSTLSCALANPSPAISSTGLLVFWRVAMGCGIGGDYPLAATITSEFAPTRWRGAMMAAVFSMQGIGQLLAAVVALVVTVAFKGSFISIPGVSACDAACRLAADRSWRLIVGFGAVPACAAMYYRITIPETPRYTFDVAQDVEQGDADVKAYMAGRAEGDVDSILHMRCRSPSWPMTVPRASWGDFFAYFRPWKNFRVLLGTTLSWFLLDMAFYGLQLNQSAVLYLIGYTRGDTLYHTLYNNAVGMIILTCAGGLPGYWTSILTIDTLGRKPIQMVGFLVVAGLFGVLGFAHRLLNTAGMLALYIAAQFFFNFGPNTTTFVVPGECFPTRYRATAHGLSAAAGKAGAILAQGISIPLLERDRTTRACTSMAAADDDCSPWLDRLMLMFALFMLLGCAASLLVPETKGATLEELSGEQAGPEPLSTPRMPDGGGFGYDGGGDDGDEKRGGRRRRHHHQWWSSPFAGGRPAGFFLARQRAAARSAPRVGIMTTPDLATQQREHEQQQQQQQQQQQRETSWVSGGGGSVGSRRRPPLSVHPTPSSSSSRASSPVVDGKRRWVGRHRYSGNNGEYEEVGEDAVTMHGLSPPPLVKAGWGAGWGRVDRGGRAASRDNMLLQDVGSLLK